MTLRALLFDLDGTLAHTDPIHEIAWRELLEPHGIALDHHAYLTRISGRINPVIVADLLPALDPEARARLIADKEARFRALAPTLQPVAGSQALLTAARRAGLALALVSNAPRANASHVLTALALTHAFDVIVLAEDVGVGKPDPRPYLHALERLGVTADEGFAFEDSVSGIRSAVAAGLEVAGITTGHDAATLASAGAAPCVPSFDDARLWTRLGLDPC